MEDLNSLIEDMWFGDTDEPTIEEKAAASRAADVARRGIKPFPASVARLVTILQDPDFTTAQVERALSQDPVTTAKLLALSNSSQFVSKTPVTSIRQAVMRLGAATVLEMVVEVALREVYADASGVGSAIIEHSSQVAKAVQMIQRAHRFPSKFLYLAGLLHDIGKLALLQSGEHDYPSKECDQRDHAAVRERQALGFDHATMGAIAVRAWGLPDPLPKVISWHHEPGHAFKANPEVARMVALLRVAEDLVLIDEDPTHDELREMTQDASWDYVGLDAGDAYDLLDLLHENGLTGTSADWKEHAKRSRERHQHTVRALGL